MNRSTTRRPTDLAARGPLPLFDDPAPAVLLVAGQEATILELERLLWLDGLDVEKVADEPAALEAVASALLGEGTRPLPMVVVIDQPRSTDQGLQLAAHLKQVRPGLRVVLVADSAEPRTVAEARRIGVEAVFVRAYDPDDVRTAVRALVERSLEEAARVGSAAGPPGRPRDGVR